MSEMSETLDEAVQRSIKLHAEAGLPYPVRFVRMCRELGGTKAAIVRIMLSGSTPANPSKMIAAGHERYTLEAITRDRPEFDDQPRAREAAIWRLNLLKNRN